jgi:succinoglycan biosynthesis transport protein ExoP
MSDLENQHSETPDQVQGSVPHSDYIAPKTPLSYPTIDIANSSDEDFIDLLDYWRIAVKRRWIIFSITLLILILTAIGTWGSPPIYRASINIQIDPEQTAILPFKETMDRGSNFAESQEYLQTQFKVLSSKTLADRVIRSLKLESNPNFHPEDNTNSIQSVFQWLRSVFLKSNEKQASAEEIRRKYSAHTKYFIDNLSVKPVRNSRLVEVSFDSVDPVLAALIVNTLANEYIELNFEVKYDATQKASKFLEKQSTDLKARLEKSEEDLVRFSQRHDIYTIGEKENVVLQTLSDLNAAVTSAKAERIQKESVWDMVRSASPNSFPYVLRNPLIKELETNVANLKVEQAKLSASFRAGWPEYDQVREQLTEAQSQLSAEKQKAIDNARMEYQTALRRERLLTNALNVQKREAGNFNQNSIQYNILKRQVDTDKQLYDGLLQRMKEAEVSAGLKSSNIHIVDEAEPPTAAYKPKKILNMGLALITGLILGIGLAFLTERLDSSFKTPDDIDRYLSVPSLGIIPSLNSMTSHSKHLLLSEKSNNNSHPSSVELVTHRDTHSILSEAYRNLRTSILLSPSNGHPPKLLVVTSSQQGEGKTTTSINIAITLAQAGGNVILLDCDMRKPRMHRVLNLFPDNGMSTFLSGLSEMSPLIQKTEIPNLYAVSSGRIPPNPAELIGSSRMKEGLSFLGRSFNYVIIDTPPVLSVTDARIMGTMADGVILVIKGGSTPRDAVRLTKRLLQEVHVRILGSILNEVNILSADYSYYSKYYYYNYKSYGDKQHNGSKDSV